MRILQLNSALLLVIFDGGPKKIHPRKSRKIEFLENLSKNLEKIEDVDVVIQKMWRVLVSEQDFRKKVVAFHFANFGKMLGVSDEMRQKISFEVENC